MEDFFKYIANSGPGVVRFFICFILSTIAISIFYDRFIRIEGGPSVRDVAPMLFVFGFASGLLVNRVLSKRSRKSR